MPSSTPQASPRPRDDPRPTVLVIEDDPAVAQVLIDLLHLEDPAQRVAHASTAAQAKALLAAGAVDLILLELVLPDADGLVLCADLRARTDAPIIVCSATSRRRDALLALKLGADTFIPKPFDVDELLARIKAVRRRAAWARPARPGPTGITPGGGPAAAAGGAAHVRGAEGIHVEALLLVPTQRRVMLANETLPLTRTEYRLLALLMSRPDHVFSRQQLTEVVCRDDEARETAGSSRAVDLHIHRLRAKLSAAQERTTITAPTIITLRGCGYGLITQEGQGQLSRTA